MRTLAIGDIHGCSVALDRLLEAVAPKPDDLIVTLGDYVNRGPDSRGVIDRLIKLHADGRLIALRGNHEQLMLDARLGEWELERFLALGGTTALLSYANNRQGTLADVPDTHWEFLQQTCRDWHENDTHFFVHAGVEPDLPLNKQPIAALHWKKFDAPPPHCSGKIMICGHTQQERGQPKNIGHAICIDTVAHGNGWLTCLDTNTGQLWQAKQRGEDKRSNISM